MSSVKALRSGNVDAMRAAINRPLCGDQKAMTPERIIKIVQLKGEFTVTRRYRDDALRSRVMAMIKAGLLRRVPHRDCLMVKLP